MSDGDSLNPREPFKIKRDVLKSSPNRVTAMWLCGVFILISSVFIGVSVGYWIFGASDDAMAYWFGLFFTLLAGGVVGWFTLVLQENAQDVQIKVVQQR